MQHRHFLLLLILVLTQLAAVSGAETPVRTFVLDKNTALRSDKLVFRINRPKAQKGATLDASLQLKGCWVKDGLKSVVAKDKRKKSVKFTLAKDGSVLEFKKVKTAVFPINVTVSFTQERDIIARAGSVIANGRSACEKVKTASGKTRLDCSAAQAITVRNAVSGVGCSVASNELVGSSFRSIVFADGDPFTLRKIGEPLRFVVSGGSFLTDVSDFTVIVNDTVYASPDLQLVDGALVVNAVLADGRNTARVHATDSDGYQMIGDFEFWAGANTLRVNLVNQALQPATTGKVTVTIADDPRFLVLANYANGQVDIAHLPGTTISIVAQGDDGSAGFVAAAGSDGTTTITMIAPLSPTADATSSAADGWVPVDASSNVSVVDHQESEGIAAVRTLDAEGPDKDVVLSTSGEGTRFMMRIFRTDPRSRLVRIRYRFQTAEFPGGYFGSKYNDFYNVALRGSSGASILDDGSSMNALGSGAFSPTGHTVWKSTVIPVNREKNPAGETVQAIVAVANVADGAYDSQVVVDKIEESPFAITDATLLDLDNQSVRHLSAAPHTYFDGFTYLNGTITLEGEASDKISKLYLQIMDQGVELARAELSTQAAAKLYNKSFGKSGKIEIKNPMLLFKVFPGELGKLAPTEDKTYSLVIQATSKNGASAHKSMSAMSALILYTGLSRYDGRDADQGGDDWLLPSVKKKVDELGSLSWGDFSNMNGGVFPPHQLHRDGRSADGWIEGYNSRDANTADALIALLNGGLANKIRFMYVAYRRSEGNAFYNAIRGRTLTNGRKVENVILPDAQHTTHFHLEF